MPQVTDAYGNTFNVDRRDVGDVERQAQYEKSLIDGTVFEKYNIDKDSKQDVRNQMATAQNKARELGLFEPGEMYGPPAEETPPPAEEPPEDSGPPNLPPMPDRTDVFLDGDNRNPMGDASFNLAKFSEDFMQKFSTVGARTGKSSLDIGKLRDATPQDIALYDLNKDGKIDVTDALDIQTAGGATRIGGEKLQSIYNAIHDNSALMEELGYRSDPKTFLLDDGRTFTVDNPTLDSSYEQTGFSNAFLNENAVYSGFDQQDIVLV